MSLEIYREKMDKFWQIQNFSVADKDFYAQLDEMAEYLKAEINANTEIPAFSGTAYYVSNDGDDSANGKTPETAWKTLEHIKTVEFGFGDALLFRRGDTFRGNLPAHSNMTYSAYGEGPKPRILSAIDAKKTGKWVKTDMPNIWRFDQKISDNEFFKTFNTIRIAGEIRNDIELVVFNSGECYSKRKYNLSDLDNDLDFVYNSIWSTPDNTDDCIYLYSEINPDDRFDTIDISIGGTVFNMPKNCENVRLNNLEMLMGGMSVWGNGVKNFKMDYCITGFMGGCLQSYAYKGRRPVPRGGGAGCWHSCDGFTVENCYIYEQFDSGVTPQYDGLGDEPSIFKDFETRNCLFEACEYTLEYFAKQPNTEHRYKNLYFGYNICRKGGYGFGDKQRISAYIKTWNHQNYSDGIYIEHNIFDRAAADTLDVGAKDFEGNPSYEFLPKMKNNMYIQKRDFQLGNINTEPLNFNEAAYNRMKEIEFEENPIFIYAE